VSTAPITFCGATFHGMAKLEVTLSDGNDATIDLGEVDRVVEQLNAFLAHTGRFDGLQWIEVEAEGRASVRYVRYDHIVEVTARVS
jgi:hypothetical protein